MTTKPSVQKPPAEMIGNFSDLLGAKKCEDGRNVFRFHSFYLAEDTEDETELFVLAATELQAWQVLRSNIGTIEKMTQEKMSERYRLQVLKLMEEQNGEPQDDAEA